MSEYKKGLLKGTLILTAAGLISRIAGFFYKIFLSRAIGAEQIGIYQLAMPLYLLAFSVCVTGIQSALSRLIAARFARQQPKKAFDTFFTGLFLSLFLSLGAAFLLYRFAEPLSLYGLREIRCAPLLRIFSFSLPMACVHACVTSYYYGRRRTGIPALGQLLEQGVRICVSFLCYGVAQEKQIVPTAALAAAGALAGELASCLFSLILLNMETDKHRYALHTLEKPGKRAGEILSLAVPLTLNHVMVTILHSTEAILIPGMLLSSGLSSREALSLYGVLTGMAMPMLFFPSAITNSIAVMLLPSVAEDQARGQTARIRRTIESTVHYCLLLGIFAAGVFFFFGGDLGTMLFGSPATGAFLKILAFLSPFLYLNSTLSSILSGKCRLPGRPHWFCPAGSAGLGDPGLSFRAVGRGTHRLRPESSVSQTPGFLPLPARRLDPEACRRLRPEPGPLPVRLRLDRRSVSPGSSAEAFPAASVSAARLSGVLSGGMEKIYLTELDNFLRM